MQIPHRSFLFVAWANHRVLNMQIATASKINSRMRSRFNSCEVSILFCFPSLLGFPELLNCHLPLPLSPLLPTGIRVLKFLKQLIASRSPLTGFSELLRRQVSLLLFWFLRIGLLRFCYIKPHVLHLPTDNQQ